jgi:hypothetical protein
MQDILTLPWRFNIFKHNSCNTKKKQKLQKTHEKSTTCYYGWELISYTTCSATLLAYKLR